MPPKHKPVGRTLRPKSCSSAASDSSSPNVMDPEVVDQLELELCWCIQQLETSLSSGKLNEKQSLDANRTLNVLKSSTAPIIKKRQFMRTTFGDYRIKMSNDQKKLGKTSAQVKFAAADSKPNSSGADKKSIFIKKAATKTNENVKSDENTFKFNFSEPEIK